jgi:hypothetical protein
MIEVVSPATHEHVESMRGRIRSADLEEFEALFEGDIIDNLKTGVSASVKSWAGVVNGEVICVCGVAPVPEMPKSGAVWLVGTDALEANARGFLRHSKDVLNEMLCSFPHLWNFADARNSKALQWLQWLGFAIREPIPYGPYGYLFHLFEIGEPHV